MDLKLLKNTPPWNWPEDTGKKLLGILGDDHAEASDRLLAAELAGDFTVASDELAEALLATVGRGDESEELRGKAVISLGPALEFADTVDVDDYEEDRLSEHVFRQIQESLRRLYYDADVPVYVRRRILEAAVRAPQGWHEETIRAAYASDDETWRLTAVFCMGYVRGFDEQIIEALNSADPDTHYHAVCAAGNWEVDGAWAHVATLAAADHVDKQLRLAAIDAVASIRPLQALEILEDLTDSDDEDVVDAAFDALAMVEAASEYEDHAEGDDDDY